jgi:hypothetical protein
LWHAPFGCIYFLLLFGPSFHLVFGEAEIRTHIQGPSSPQNSPLDQGASLLQLALKLNDGKALVLDTVTLDEGTLHLVP